MDNAMLGFDLDIVAIGLLAGLVAGGFLIVAGWVDEYWRFTHRKGR